MQILKPTISSEHTADSEKATSKFLIKFTYGGSGARLTPEQILAELADTKTSIIVHDKNSQNSVICNNAPLSYLAHYDSYGEGVIPVVTDETTGGIDSIFLSIAITPTGAAFELDNDEKISISLKLSSKLTVYATEIFALESPTRTSENLVYTSLTISGKDQKSFDLSSIDTLLLPVTVDVVDRYQLVHTNAKSVNYNDDEIQFLQALNNDFTIIVDGAEIADKTTACHLLGVSTAKELSIFLNDATTYKFYSVSSENRSKMFDRVNTANQNLVITNG